MLIVNYYGQSNDDSEIFLSFRTHNLMTFRCSSPVRVLVETTMFNLQSSDTNTVVAVTTALSAETSGGTLADPQNTVGVVDIPVATSGAISNDQLMSTSTASHFI